MIIVSHVATQRLRYTDLLRSENYGSCTQKSGQSFFFFDLVYLRSLETLVVLIETFAGSLIRMFSSHCMLLIWGPMHMDKQHVYGLPVAINVARFIAFCGKLKVVSSCRLR